MKQICQDLREEYESLDSVVSDLSMEEWLLVTPFDGWTIKDEISHIAYYDQAARLSVTSQVEFSRHMEKMLEGFTSFDDLNAKVNAVGGSMPVPELLAWWREERYQLLAAYEALDPKDRLPWYGPTMSARSSATARLMETWAHGQDIVDALKINRRPTRRLQHVAHIGVTTFGWSFKNRGMTVPDQKVMVRLSGLDGEIWEWNTDAPDEWVKGDALDFCLVVTQRRNIADTGLEVKGAVATQWMTIAQAFAGPPEEGPVKGERVLDN